jgi:hypothetical protein
MQNVGPVQVTWVREDPVTDCTADQAAPLNSEAWPSLVTTAQNCWLGQEIDT